jgi:hypothetical protein
VSVSRSSRKSHIAKRIRVEPSFDTGDCGYRAIIIALLYLSLRAKSDEQNPLVRSDTLKKILRSGPDDLYKKLLDLNLIKADAGNAEILRAMISAASDWIFSLTEINNYLTPRLRKLAVESSWLHDHVKTIVVNGLWEFYNPAYANTKSIRKLEQDIRDKTLELLEKQHVDPLSVEFDQHYEEMRAHAKIMVCSALKESALEKCIADVINELYARSGIWLDMNYLKSLTMTLLGSPDLLFDDKGININGNGPQTSHWYLDLPEDEYSAQLVSAFRSQIPVIESMSTKHAFMDVIEQPSLNTVFSIWNRREEGESAQGIDIHQRRRQDPFM